MNIATFNRGTGRTDRILLEALNAKSGYVIVVAATHELAQRMCDRLVQLWMERQVYLAEVGPPPVPKVVNDGTKVYLSDKEVTFETPNERVDWNGGRWCGAHPSVKVLFDHYALERHMGWALEEWMRQQ